MSKLSKNGYLKELHTSSGKIPTDKGWRYYIDELLEIQRTISDEKEKLKKNYREHLEKNNSALQELSKTFFYVLEHSQYNLSPKPERAVYKEIILRTIDRKTVSGVLFSGSGTVKIFTLKTKEPVKQEFVGGIAALLNKMFSGITLSGIKNDFAELTELHKSDDRKKIEFIENYFDDFLNLESGNSDTASNVTGAIKKDIYGLFNEEPVVLEKGNKK
jgi:heat-inducible transcriptional repressor